MNKTFRTILVALAAMLTVGVYAQEEDTPKKVNFQIRGGLNISNATTYVDNHYENSDSKVGFNISGIMDCPLGRKFYLQTGLALTSKGAKVKDIPVGESNLDATMNAVYLQIPVYFAYKFDLVNTSNKIGISAGPYFAYGVGGKTTWSPRNTSYGITENTFDSNGLWNRPDVGIGLEFSFEMERVIFILGSELGLTKIWKRDQLTQDVHIRNSNNYISVGYKF